MVRTFERSAIVLQVSQCRPLRRLTRRRRNPADMAHTCRGNISISNALIHTEDSCNFLISNGGTQTFHLRAANEIERLVLCVTAVRMKTVLLPGKSG